MSKVVYLIISDLHATYKAKENRYDYMGEVNYALNEVIKIGEDYKKKGYIVRLIFLGDIVNSSFKDQTQAIILNNIFVYLNDTFDKVYSVLGNHEFSYYKDNPFWTLVEQLNSEKVKSVLNRTWQPLGLLQLVEVVDKLQDGNVMFQFNHHGMPINMTDAGYVNIGLFHLDITCKAIVEDAKVNRGLDVFETNPIYLDKTGQLNGYDYAFIGHNHKLYGHWSYVDDNTNYKTELYHLASLGRPNHSEVNDNFLERNVPAVIIENGIFSRVEDNKFMLQSRAETVKEELVEKAQEKYQEVKEKKELIKYIPTGDEPIENLLNSLNDYPIYREYLNAYLNTNILEMEHNLVNDIEEIIKL